MAIIDAPASAQGASLMSAYRVHEGLHPLVVIPSLQLPAESKARDMATRDYAAHDDPPGDPDAPAGRPWNVRDEAYGYVGALGEVIDWGTAYVRDANGAIVYTVDPVTGAHDPQIRPMNPAEAIANWTATVGEEHWQTIHIADYTACGYAVAVDASGEAFHICVFGINPGVVQPPKPPVVPPPAPLPAPPAPKSVWRVNANPLAKPVTVLGTTAGVVTFENRKGVIGHMQLAAFLKKYTQVS